MAKQTKGYCKYCGKEYTRGGMLRHLNACKGRAEALAEEKGKRKCGYYELVLSGKYQKDYWLIVEMREDALLRDLDQFIRDIWVECCGHLSAFTIGGVSYESHPSEDRFWGPPARSMACMLKRALSVGMIFSYEYDFGSTTELEIKVQDYRGQGIWEREKITILSRNNPPRILCSQCGERLAKWVNPEGYYSGNPFWCEECAEEMEKGETSGEEAEWEEDSFADWMLPVCNSPRMGVCGYTGSEIYPDQFEADKKQQETCRPSQPGEELP